MPPRDLQIQIAVEGDCVKVTLAGEAHFDFDTADKHIQAVMGHKPRTVLVDAGGLSFMSSIGMCFLISLRREVKEAGGTMKITALQPLVRKAMEYAHVIHLFEVPPDDAAASPPA